MDAKIKNRCLCIISRVLLFSIIWLILSDGNLSSWWIGMPAVFLAAASSIVLIPPVTFVWLEALRFAFFFFIRSLAGGTDVAWRALHPLMPIAPNLVEYPLRISPGLPQVFMVNTVSLLPGTLSAKLDKCVLKVHVLDKEKDFMAEIESVERRVAQMFGVPLNFDEKDQ